MKINNLKIDEDDAASFGLKKISMAKLPQVVALVGRNGSGKSRILKSIISSRENLSLQDFLEENLVNVPSSLKNILDPILKHKELNLLVLELNGGQISSEERRALRDEYRKQLLKLGNLERIVFENSISELTNSRISIENNLPGYFKVIDYQLIRNLQEKIEGANDSDTFESIVENLSETNFDEFDLIHKSALSFLIKLPHQLLADKDDCYGDESKFSRRVSFKRFNLFKKNFETFIKKKLDWEKVTTTRKVTAEGVNSLSRGVWLIDGREFNYSEFSDGEKTLFAYVMLFFLIELNPKIHVKDSILFIDEPELHLHPESEIELIDGMRKIIGDTGQLWIATHSLNILSHLNHDEIFMVKNGEVFHPSESTPQNSLNELMGLEDRVHKLGEFVSSISSWAYVNFMTQCFFDPEVIDHAAEQDPQIEVFKKSIQSTNSNTLLDFGAGKGRLYERLKKDENFEKIKYSALEPYTKLHPTLKELGVLEIFNNYKALPENYFDQIVLCNVLHEIPITDLVAVINRIVKALKPNGHIVIIEDRFLPKGEKIGETGFLLMEEPELMELFNLKEHPHIIKSNNLKYEERIMCALISKKELPNQMITKIQVKNALNSLKQSSIKRIKELRDSKTSEQPIKGISKGRRSGLYSQLYINAVLSEELIN